MLERFKLLLKLEEKQEVRKSVKHIAVTTQGIEKYAKEKNKDVQETYKKSFETINSLIKIQVKKDLPLLTIYLSKEKQDISKFIDEFVIFLGLLKESNILNKNKIKVSILGKWYDLPDKAVEPIKNIIQETKDYDSFFLNFCINYDGQEEILDACKLIARQIKSEKIDIDSITKETIKDNLYSSYFLPPDLIIKNGKRTNSGLLLWDSVNAEVIFTGKPFPEFDKEDFEKLF